MTVLPERLSSPTESEEAQPPAPSRRRPRVTEGLSDTERAWLRGQLVDAPESARVAPHSTPVRRGRKADERPAPARSQSATDLGNDERAGKYRVVLACTCHSNESSGSGT
jgi:hypothetical protein